MAFAHILGNKDLTLSSFQDYDVVSEVMSRFFESTELGDLDRMVPGLISLFSTYFIKESTYTFALNNAKLNPTYFYSFSYNGPNTLYYLFADDPTGNALELPDAVSHADELIYLFDLPLIKLNANDTNVAKKMVKMFAEFVQHGDFGHLGSESFSVPSLDPYDPIGNAFLEMNLQSSVQENYPSTYSLRVESEES